MTIRLTSVTLSLLAAAFTVAAAQAQVAPYNSADPQNYNTPAAQSYGQQGQQPDHAPSPDQYVPPQQTAAMPADMQAAPQQDPYQGPQSATGFGQQQDQPNPQAPTTTLAPPPIPDYTQPEAPGDGYIWTPGYWAWTGYTYQWVPGAWVEAPYTGALWTPGYWGYYDGGYLWNAGYWGPTVGYYGGINYGFGFFGIGFFGGYWSGPHFFYNRFYTNVGVHIGYTYGEHFSGITGHPGGLSYATLNDGHNGFHPAATTFAARGSSTITNHGVQTTYGTPVTHSTAAPTYAPRATPTYSAPRPTGGQVYNGGNSHPSAPSRPTTGSFRR